MDINAENTDGLREARTDEIEKIARLIDKNRTSPSHAPLSTLEAVAAHIQQDLNAPHKQFRWLVSNDTSNFFAAHIAVIAPPPIYDLNGGLAAVKLGAWSSGSVRGLRDHLSTLEEWSRKNGAVMFVANCQAADPDSISTVESAGYRATTHYLIKSSLTQSALSPLIRVAVEQDIAALVAFNREARDRLHEANSDFWQSHPEAETRFGLWMKFSMSMRDRTIFIANTTGRTNGFIIAQPSSPIQVSVAHDSTKIGIIDDFHCDAFGKSLDRVEHASSAVELLNAAETSLSNRGNSAAIAICPAAWPAKLRVLEHAGYRILSTWHTKRA